MDGASNNIFLVDKTCPRDAQGNVGEARAIYELTKLGFIVSKPIFDTVYDLLVDDGEKTSRVSVKTSSYLREYNSGNTAFEVTLATTIVKQMDGKHSWNKRGRRKNFDLLFVVVSTGDCWLIPEEHIDGQFTIGVGGTSTKYSKYKLSGA